MREGQDRMREVMRAGTRKGQGGLGQGEHSTDTAQGVPCAQSLRRCTPNRHSVPCCMESYRYETTLVPCAHTCTQTERGTWLPIDSRVHLPDMYSRGSGTHSLMLLHTQKKLCIHCRCTSGHCTYLQTMKLKCGNYIYL